jgi:hypothetical protein
MLDRGRRELIGILFLDANKPKALDDEVLTKIEKYIPRLARILTAV